MENKNNQIFQGIVIGLLVIMTIFTIFNFNDSDNITYSDDKLIKNTISVSGSANLETSPDQAELYFRIETINNDPKTAQSENTAKSNKIIALLKNNGLKENEIETLNYNLESYKEWHNNNYVDKGFRTSHTLKLTIKDLEKTGNFINLIVENDANSVENIKFSLSKNKENQLKSELLSEAAKDAKLKADSVADSLNVDVKGLISLTESPSNVYVPYYQYAAMESKAETPVIQPQNIPLSISVIAVFEVA